MKIAELKERMKQVNEEYNDDPEVCHHKHDQLLLEYIYDDEVYELFGNTTKWYA